MSEHNIACQYFEHVAEYRVAACRECRYAVWPDQIKGHLQNQHKVSRNQAEIVGELIRSWPGLLQYPSKLEVLGGVPQPVPQLPVYTDEILCQLDPSGCQYVVQSKEAIRKHWHTNHQGWSAGGRQGRPSRTSAQRLQTRVLPPVIWQPPRIAVLRSAAAQRQRQPWSSAHQQRRSVGARRQGNG
jgi:hypothetical protein